MTTGTIDPAAAAKAAEDKSPEAVRTNENVEPHLLLLLRQWLRSEGFDPTDWTNEQLLTSIRQAARTWTVAPALDERSAKLGI